MRAFRFVSRGTRGRGSSSGVGGARFPENRPSAHPQASWKVKGLGGRPAGTRTPNNRLRRPVLYPLELRAAQRDLLSMANSARGCLSGTPARHAVRSAGWGQYRSLGGCGCSTSWSVAPRYRRFLFRPREGSEKAAGLGQTAAQPFATGLRTTLVIVRFFFGWGHQRPRIWRAETR